MISIDSATRLASWLAPDEATWRSTREAPGWQRVSIARSISQDVLPVVAPSSLRDSAQSSARFGRAAEIFRSEGVTRALSKIAICIIVDERAPSDKRRQIHCRFLSPFAARFRAAIFHNELVRRWCLSFLPADAGKTDTRCSLEPYEQDEH